MLSYFKFYQFFADKWLDVSLDCDFERRKLKVEVDVEDAGQVSCHGQAGFDHHVRIQNIIVLKQIAKSKLRNVIYLK